MNTSSTFTNKVEPPPARDVWQAIFRGLRGRCPNCGEGKIFRAFLKVADECPACHEPLHHHRADDFPAYVVIVIVGHVVVPLVLEPYAKIVPISATILDLPLPPFILGDVVVMPNQIRIVGRPERINQISTVTTEDISVRDLMENKTVEVNLVPLPDVVIRDLQGHPVTHVTVQITLRKSAVAPPVTPGSGPPP